MLVILPQDLRYATFASELVYRSTEPAYQESESLQAAAINLAAHLRVKDKLKIECRVAGAQR